MILMRMIRGLWPPREVSGRKRVGYTFFGVGILFLGSGVAFLFLVEGSEGDQLPTPTQDFLVQERITPAPKSGEPVLDDEEASGGSARAVDAGGARSPVLEFISGVAGKIEEPRSLNELLALIDELRGVLASSDRVVATSALVAFLDSGRDASTGLSFIVRADGFLDAAPSLRVILLDELEKLSSSSAAEYARAILDKSTSPDEWAVALRSLGRNRDPSEMALDEYFNGKVDELLHNDAWLEDPTVGFLQAFDAIVYRGGVRFVPRLTGLLGERVSPSVQYGANLALDRLVMGDFSGVMREVQSMDSAPWSGREDDRARLFARADVRDAPQLKLVEDYLLDPEVSEEEVTAFAEVFPYFDVEVSNNLFTRQDLEPFSVLLEKDRAALEVVREWRRDLRFGFPPEVIDELENRLEEFVASGERGLE